MRKGVKDKEIPPFIPASDNIGIFSILYRKYGQTKIEENLNNLGPLMNELFIESITNINNELINDNSIAFLQELNNNEFVYETLNNTKNQIFISNIYETFAGTYPTLGYIFKGDYTFAEFIYDNKIHETRNNTRIDINDNNKCYSLVTLVENNYNKKIMNIRDLGHVYELEGGFYLLKDLMDESKYREVKKLDPSTPIPKFNLKEYEAIPDAGRPISMIISSNKKEIYLNCHIPNPSILKVYKRVDDKIINIGNNLSVLQLKTDPLENTTAVDLWKEYCKKMLETEIVNMLMDYKTIDMNEIDQYTWIIGGDFNDSDRYLINETKFELNLNLNINNKDISLIFKISENTKTCCINTNSSTVDLKYIDPTINEDPRKRVAFNKNLPKVKELFNKYLNKEYIENNKDQDDKLFEIFLGDNNSLSNIKKFAFYGDNIGFYSKKNGNISKLKTIDKLTSDHIFVKAEITIPNAEVEGGRRTRRRNGKKMMRKSRKGRRKSCRRK